MQTLARLVAHLCDVLPLGRRERLQARERSGPAQSRPSRAPHALAALGISPSPHARPSQPLLVLRGVPTKYQHAFARRSSSTPAFGSTSTASGVPLHGTSITRQLASDNTHLVATIKRAHALPHPSAASACTLGASPLPRRRRPPGCAPWMRQRCRARTVRGRTAGLTYWA
jgi:hypothetical protein